ncbi:MAG: CDP-glycerol glycerophosphotransferase family protein [Methanothrix sp.]
MKVLIYDHQIETQRDDIYYVSCNYWDKEKSNNQNYTYANSLSFNSDHFSKAVYDLSQFSDNRFNGKTIKEMISFEGISLWWFYEIAMRLNYIQYLRYIDQFQSFFNKKEFSSVLYDINDSILLSAVKDFCSGRYKLIEVASKKSRSISSIKTYGEYIHTGLNFFADMVISRIYNTDKKSPLVIASYTNHWTRYNVTKDVQKDGIFDNIQKVLEECNIDYVGLEYNNESLRNYVKTRWSKRKYAPGKWIPLNAYATWKSILQSAKIFKMVNRSLSAAKFSENRDAFFLNMLKNHIGTSLFLISEILSVINALDLIKPNVVLTSCEYCKMGRAAVAAGNKENLQTIALQHGIITPRHEGYIFSKSETNSINDAVNSRPLPRHTLLYGPAYREILINNSNYPEKSLVVTGQPRYDYLYEISKSLDSDKFLAEKNLKHPLVVWTSQPARSVTENMKDTECFLYLLDSIPINLFIKPHPIETDLSIYSPLTQRKNVVLSKDIDLYKLLSACDLIITRASTTAMEAAALNKPIIVLNLTGEQDVIDYVKEGIALGVYDEKELPIAVKKLLENDDSLRSQREEYIKKYLYNMDGRSGYRVAAFIKDLISNINDHPAK